MKICVLVHFLSPYIACDKSVNIAESTTASQCPVGTSFLGGAVNPHFGPIIARIWVAVIDELQVCAVERRKNESSSLGF